MATTVRSAWWWALALALPMSAFADKGQPWSEVAVGNVATKGDGEYDLWVTMINGSRDFPDAVRYELAPGANALRLTSKKRGKSGEHISLPYTLELQPCMRYAMVADHAGEQAGRPWRIEVKAQTPIKACVKRFGDPSAMSVQTAATP